LKGAYREIASAEPRFTVFGSFEPNAPPRSEGGARGAVLYRQVFGHPFGMTSSVVNFCRAPAFMCWAASLLLGVPVGSYIDDYIVVDVAGGQESAQEALGALHRMLAIMPLATDKHKGMAAQQKVLGVQCDTSRAASHGEVSYFPDAQRCERILGALRQCKEEDRMGPAVAEKQLGKLGFVTTSLYGRVGRAAVLPLIQRAHRDTDPAFPWTPAMEEMLVFFTALLSAGFLVRKVVQLDRAAADHRPPVVIYTDACTGDDLGNRPWDFFAKPLYFTVSTDFLIFCYQRPL